MTSFYTIEQEHTEKDFNLCVSILGKILDVAKNTEIGEAVDLHLTKDELFALHNCVADSLRSRYPKVRITPSGQIVWGE